MKQRQIWQNWLNPQTLKCIFVKTFYFRKWSGSIQNYPTAGLICESAYTASDGPTRKKKFFLAVNVVSQKLWYLHRRKLTTKKYLQVYFVCLFCFLAYFSSRNGRKLQGWLLQKSICFCPIWRVFGPWKKKTAGLRDLTLTPDIHLVDMLMLWKFYFRPSDGFELWNHQIWALLGLWGKNGATL